MIFLTKKRYINFFQNSRNVVSVVELKVTLPGQEDRKISTVLEGSKYQLRAQVLDHDRKSQVLYRGLKSSSVFSSYILRLKMSGVVFQS